MDSLRKGKAVGSNLEKFFFQMGARVKMVEVAPVARGWRRVDSRGEDLGVVLDIRRDKRGSFFEVRILTGTNHELLVLNAQPRKKHLLLLSRQFDEALCAGQAKVPVWPGRRPLVRRGHSPRMSQ